MRWQIPTGLCCVLPLALAILVACLIPRHINKSLRGGVESQIIWCENSPAETYARYARDDNPTDPLVQTDFYLLNITNLAAVKAGKKPQLQQLGPYSYRKHTVKHNIWFDKQGRVAFTRDEFYTDLPSNALFPSLDDVVTTVNVPLLGALAKAHSIFGRFVALQLLLEVIASFHDPNVDGLFMKRTVRELLWGYDDPLLQKLQYLAPGLDTRFQLVPNITASSLHPSRQDIVNTGINNISDIWNTEVWSNHTTIKGWRPPHLEPVEGSDGIQFRPDLRSGDSVRVWAPELFKSASMTADTTASLDSINLLRFRPDPSQGEPNPIYYQTYQGLMNITSPTAAGKLALTTSLSQVPQTHFFAAHAQTSLCSHRIQCSFDHHGCSMHACTSSAATWLEIMFFDANIRLTLKETINPLPAKPQSEQDLAIAYVQASGYLTVCCRARGQGRCVRAPSVPVQCPLL